VYAPAAPGCSALLVAGDRIAWLGTDEVATGHVDSADEVIDLRGALITPAFVDAHAHVTETGLALAGVDLTAVASVGEALALVERAARIDGGPVLGHGWDERGWAERRPPTRAELDRASGGRPVLSARSVDYGVSHRDRAIVHGGIGVFHTLVHRVGLPQAIDDRLHLLKVHLPYRESDHVLNGCNRCNPVKLQ